MDFVAWPPKTQQKSLWTGWRPTWWTIAQENLASQLKVNTKKVIWPHKDHGCCGLATQNTAKITQDCLKANLKDHWSKEIWPPSLKYCNPLDYFLWSEVEREVNKHPHNTLASLNAKILVVMAKIDREVVIPACKRVQPRIEAVVEANEDFIK